MFSLFIARIYILPYAHNFVLPLNLRLLSTLLPVRVFTLAKKPCFRFRRTNEGWNVRFISMVPSNRAFISVSGDLIETGSIRRPGIVGTKSAALLIVSCESILEMDNKTVFEAHQSFTEVMILLTGKRFNDATHNMGTITALFNLTSFYNYFILRSYHETSANKKQKREILFCWYIVVESLENS